MRKLWRSLGLGVLVWVVRFYRQMATQLFEIRAVTFYVKAVRSARLAFIGLVAGLVAAGLLVASFMTMTVALIWVLPITPSHRPCALLAVSSVYFLATIIVLCVVASERRWMRMTGASELVGRVTKRKRSHQ